MVIKVSFDYDFVFLIIGTYTHFSRAEILMELR